MDLYDCIYITGVMGDSDAPGDYRPYATIEDVAALVNSVYGLKVYF